MCQGGSKVRQACETAVAWHGYAGRHSSCPGPRSAVAEEKKCGGAHSTCCCSRPTRNCPSWVFGESSSMLACMQSPCHSNKGCSPRTPSTAAVSCLSWLHFRLLPFPPAAPLLTSSSAGPLTATPPRAPLPQVTMTMSLTWCQSRGCRLGQMHTPSCWRTLGLMSLRCCQGCACTQRCSSARCAATC
jgi:hypothetical protein